MVVLLALISGSANAEIVYTGHLSYAVPTNFAESLYPGTSVDTRIAITMNRLHLGASINSSLHNGAYYEQQADMGCVQLGNCIQGDSRIFSIGPFAGMEFGNPKKIHYLPYAALQMSTIPLLMDRTFYDTEVVAQEWGGIASTIHSGLKPNLRVGTDILFPVWEDGPKFSIQPHINYIVDVDLFWGLGFGFSI